MSTCNQLLKSLHAKGCCSVVRSVACNCQDCLLCTDWLKFAKHVKKLLVADLQLYVDDNTTTSTGAVTTDDRVVVHWANVLQWFSVRASWVHSVEIRNFSKDSIDQHDCPPGVHCVMWQPDISSTRVSVSTIHCFAGLSL